MAAFPQKARVLLFKKALRKAVTLFGLTYGQSLSSGCKSHFLFSFVLIQHLHFLVCNVSSHFKVVLNKSLQTKETTFNFDANKADTILQYSFGFLQQPRNLKQFCKHFFRRKAIFYEMFKIASHHRKFLATSVSKTDCFLKYSYFCEKIHDCQVLRSKWPGPQPADIFGEE